MKSILLSAAAAALFASAPAIAGEFANGTPYETVSPSIVVIGKPAPKVEQKKTENKYDGFAAHFPVTALLDDPAVAKLSLDEIVGKKKGTGEETTMPMVSDAEKDKPAAETASVNGGADKKDKSATKKKKKSAAKQPETAAKTAPEDSAPEMTTPAPQPEDVAATPPQEGAPETDEAMAPEPKDMAVVPPVATDEETASIGHKTDTAPADLFKDMQIRTGD